MRARGSVPPALEFRGRLLPDDLRGAESEMAPRRGDGTGRRGDRRLRRHRGARAPRALVPGDLARSCGWRRSETEVLPVRPDEVRWHSRANLADWIHRRPGIRDLGRT